MPCIGYGGSHEGYVLVFFLVPTKVVYETPTVSTGLVIHFGDVPGTITPISD
jgi:hypothetical protein